jgi:hypothetical protein
MRGVSCEKTPSSPTTAGGGKLLALADRDVKDAVDALPNASDPPVLQVLEEELGRVSGECRPLGGEVPVLSDRELEEAVPVGSRLDVTGHDTQRMVWFCASARMLSVISPMGSLARLHCVALSTPFALRESERENIMSTTMWIVLIVALLVFFGGGGGYYWTRSHR